MKLFKCFAPVLGLALWTSAQGQVHEFKDWAIACDNTRHCEALGYQSLESDSNAVMLWLSRDAGPNAPINIQLDTDDSEDEAKPNLLTVQLGKNILKGVAPRQNLEADPRRQLLAYLLVGDEIVISKGAKRWRLSLAGSNAALLKMDDLQGRVGTPGALIRKGSKPESSVLPALTPPKVRKITPPITSAQDLALLEPILKSIKLRDCWDDLPDDSGVDASITRLSSTQVLVMRECGRGAYQSGYGLWVANSKPPFEAQRLNLPLAAGQSTDYVMNASVSNGRLSSYAKGRGINDCGESFDWDWNGRSFELVDASQSPLCRGFPGGGFSLRTWTAR